MRFVEDFLNFAKQSMLISNFWNQYIFEFLENQRCNLAKIRPDWMC